MVLMTEQMTGSLMDRLTVLTRAPTMGSGMANSTARMIGADDGLWDGEVDGSGEGADDRLSEGKL